MQQKRSQNSGRIIDMKHYTVEITNEALADMEQLYNHIAYVLLQLSEFCAQNDFEYESSGEFA